MEMEPMLPMDAEPAEVTRTADIQALSWYSADTAGSDRIAKAGIG